MNILNQSKTLKKYWYHTHPNQIGFTLIELVMVIIILGIISVVVGPLLNNKFEAVAQTTERAKWVAEAEQAMFHIKQNIALSVPYSLYTSEVLNGSDQVLEFLAADPESSMFVARYRDKQLNSFDRLQPNNDDSFDVFTELPAITTDTYVSIGTTNPLVMINDWQNSMSTGTGTLAKLNAISSSLTGSENGGPLSNLILTQRHRFGSHSPFYRAYFFQGPVAYECDTSTGFLYQLTGYTELGLSNFSARSAGAKKSRVIGNLIRCEFKIIAGSPYSAPKLNIALEIGSAQESIRLVNSIMLSNGP